MHKRKFTPRRKKKAFVKRFGRDAWRVYESMGIRVREIRDKPIQTIQEAFDVASEIVRAVVGLHQLVAMKRRPVPRFPSGSYRSDGDALVGESGGMKLF